MSELDDITIVRLALGGEHEGHALFDQAQAKPNSVAADMLADCLKIASNPKLQSHAERIVLRYTARMANGEQIDAACAY